MLARGEEVPGKAVEAAEIGPQDWPDDLAEIIYLDDFGNAMTGIRATPLEFGQRLQVSGQDIAHARTFAEAAPGEGFWYVNSCGLAEIAVNQGSARESFGLIVGDRVTMPT